MHVQIVTIGLERISEVEYHQGCKEETGIFAYVGGEVFRSIQDDPTLAGVRSTDFEVFDDLTALTQPGLTIT